MVDILPRRTSRQHLPSAKSEDWTSHAHRWSQRLPLSTMQKASSFSTRQPAQAHGVKWAPQTFEVRAPPPSAPKAVMGPRATMEVAFEAHVETRWGDTAVLVGASPALGVWQPERGLKMWTDQSCYPIWKARASIACEAGEALEYKVVILRAPRDGAHDADWEPLAHNRTLTMRAGSEVRVCASWGVPGAKEEPCSAEIPAAAPLPPPSSSGASLSKPGAVFYHSPQAPPPLPPPQSQPRVAACAGGLRNTAAQPAARQSAMSPVSPRRAHPTFASAPPPNSSFSLPLAGGVTGFTLPDGIRQRLDVIRSQDESWPPSLSSSLCASADMSEPQSSIDPTVGETDTTGEC